MTFCSTMELCIYAHLYL